MWRGQCISWPDARFLLDALIDIPCGLKNGGSHQTADYPVRTGRSSLVALVKVSWNSDCVSGVLVPASVMPDS